MPLLSRGVSLAKEVIEIVMPDRQFQIIRLRSSCNVMRHSRLCLCSCLCEATAASCRQLVLAEHRGGPEIAFQTRSAGISDCTSCTGFHINEQLGTRAKPPPYLCHTGCCRPLSGTKFASEQHKALSAAGGYNQSDPSLPASRQVLDQRTGSLCRPPTHSVSIPWHYVVASHQRSAWRRLSLHRY